MSTGQSKPPRSICKAGDQSERDGQGRLTLKQLQSKYLDTEEIGTEPLKNLRVAIKQKEEKILVVVKTEGESDVKKTRARVLLGQ